MEKAGKDIEDEDLAEAMAGKGLGTPATRADTIEKLLSRGYISRQQSGALNATPHGIRIIEILRRIPVEWITSAELTGEMEAALTAVQKGEMTATEYMNNIIEQARDLVNEYEITTVANCSKTMIQSAPVPNVNPTLRNRIVIPVRTTKERTKDAHSCFGKTRVGDGLIGKQQQNCWKVER